MKKEKNYYFLILIIYFTYMYVYVYVCNLFLICFLILFLFYFYFIIIMYIYTLSNKKREGCKLNNYLNFLIILFFNAFFYVIKFFCLQKSISKVCPPSYFKKFFASILCAMLENNPFRFEK